MRLGGWTVRCRVGAAELWGLLRRGGAESASEAKSFQRAGARAPAHKKKLNLFFSLLPPTTHSNDKRAAIR